MTSYRNSDPRPPIMQGSPPPMIPPRIDWDRPPWNRWSFQHIREILPTVEVWKGSGHASRLPRAERDLDMLAVRSVPGASSTLAGLLDETFTDGFLVLKDGAVVYERYFNGMTPRTLHLSQSMAKSITSCVAGILVGRGLLDPSRKVTDYLPELADTAWKGATLQQVLDMTSGVHFSEEYTDPYSEIGQIDVASGWKPVPPGADPGFKWPAHVWELILTLKALDRPHGEAFDYRSIETDVLAFAMERVTGRRLAQLVSDELWQKLGCEESACFTVDSAGYALADGGFNATLRDYGRFGQMVLDKGAGIVPAEWIDASRSGVHGPQFSTHMPQASYRNQFWIEDPRTRNLQCRGVFGQLIHVNFDARVVTVKLSSWPDFTSPELSAATLSAVHAIAEALS
ncbi:serine hydrolase [Mesorhizobium sp. J428]|uniref:serine hydrolase domain-containing protein n=1 Tax=Mesorhizobium sp. J428 TaxID=2898440 RepID=UPI002150E55F|nr:serine hydrolase [Mesorhizobium sp. J428]MCR5858247.1 beta-lactamase family protein [Mesorhizobium sp. J428]